jgi:hypothetical protein
MYTFPEDILINIFTYLDYACNLTQIQILKVSKTFHRLGLLVFHFNPLYILQACKNGHERIVSLYLKNDIKINGLLKYEKCLTVAIRYDQFDMVKLLLKYSSIDEVVLKMTLGASRRVAKLILDSCYKRKKKQRSNLFDKLKIKTYTNVVKTIEFKSYLLVLCCELNEKEFQNVLNHTILDDVNKNFIIQVTNRNTNYINEYKRSIKNFGNFIKKDVYMSCVRYFHHIKDNEMIKLMNDMKLDNNIIHDKIRRNEVFKIKYSKTLFDKALKYHSDNVIKSMFDTITINRKGFRDYIVLNNWYINDVLCLLNERLFEEILIIEIEKREKRDLRNAMSKIIYRLIETPEDDLDEAIESINQQMGFIFVSRDEIIDYKTGLLIE